MDANAAMAATRRRASRSPARVAARLIFGPAVFDRYVLALDEACSFRPRPNLPNFVLARWLALFGDGITNLTAD